MDQNHCTKLLNWIMDTERYDTAKMSFKVT